MKIILSLFRVSSIEYWKGLFGTLVGYPIKKCSCFLSHPNCLNLALKLRQYRKNMYIYIFDPTIIKEYMHLPIYSMRSNFLFNYCVNKISATCLSSQLFLIFQYFIVKQIFLIMICSFFLLKQGRIYVTMILEYVV